ncbi:MFS transporter [Marinomonas pollencensis]|uniref:DHA1 family inner membrane transport protein n=1 Tax=Marinomonas pollencensis TaxID=491954 RepID=A0A3E0DTA1_9GAMM|nr:MFS transporter [Marinomonas pollencensis]REG85726.1 DHA1 family inner membrane transport protein [Marinomonas pollencensis]
MQAYQWGIFAIALGAFGIGTTEFMPMGLLPVIAEGVDVSIPTAGLLISAYAVGVMIGAPIITLYLTRFSRKNALIALMGVFVLGNTLAALATNYEILMLARVVTSLSHGAFFGIGALVAMSLAPKGKQGSAVASMLLGLTIANIIGVPITTWLGQNIEWRVAFAVTAVLGLIAIIGLVRSLPAMPVSEKPDVRKELKSIAQPAALRAFALTILLAGSMFTLYTYIAPILHMLAGASENTIAIMLSLAGVGFTCGNYIGGKLADKSPDYALFITFIAQIIMAFLFSVVASGTISAAIMVFLWSVVIFGSGSAVQMKVMQIADEAPGLASSINIGAFNLGNALGAVLGGAVITLGFSYAWIPSAAALLSVAALLLLLLNRKLEKTQLQAASA